MSRDFISPLAREMEAFIAFKRALGYRYNRSEFTLRSFDRFVASHAHRRLHFEEALLAWLSRDRRRRPISVAMDLAIIRQFCLYRRRRDPKAFVPDRSWAPQSTESTFLPYVFSKAEIKSMLRLAKRPAGSRCPPPVVRMLLLILYCTGIRFGEAVGLKVGDVQRGALFVESKGRARWVPFHHSLRPEIRRYLHWRQKVASVELTGPLFVEEDGRLITVRRASDVIRRLLRAMGLKPATGRVGPRPYDIRHTYACHRLARWYRAGVDVQSRLAWLSAYMGHVDVFGTETYLHATPALLALASRRFRRRFVQR